MTIFGKSFDFRQPERLKEYWAMDRSDVTVVGDAARWAIEAILESQSKRHVKEEKRFDTRSI